VELKKGDLERFSGGLVEIINHSERYYYKAEIKSITMEGTKIVMEFSWLTMVEGSAPAHGTWFITNTRKHSFDHLNYLVNSHMGRCEANAYHRISFYCGGTDETILLYPPMGSKPKSSRSHGR
jgi:hypothetical protein